MNLLQPLGQGQGYLKAGFLGFPKSGKTYTAVLLAIAVRKALSDPRPIILFDTEGGSEYVAPMVQALTGMPPLGIKSRDFEELLEVGHAAQKEGSALVADSVTHIWRTLCDSYLAGKIKSRREGGWSSFNQRTLEFQDWAAVKAIWGTWSDFYVNAPLNIIICGRAGFEYDMQENKETHKKELVKTGVKMKTESEFGFEPSLLVEMQSEQRQDREDNWQLLRSAYVLGDRWGDLDGLQMQFPSIKSKDGKPDYAAELAVVEKFFGPHLARLRPKAHSAIRTKSEPMLVDAEGNPEWHKEQKAREILCEEIKGSLQRGEMDGQSTEAKKARAELLAGIFGTTSWTAIEGTSSAALRSGLAQLKERLGLDQKPTTPEKEPDDIPFEGAKTPAPETAPEAPADVTEISKLRSELADAIFGHEEKVLTWMREAGWLKKGQDFTKLSIERLREAVKKHGVILSKANGSSDAQTPRTAADDVPTP